MRFLEFVFLSSLALGIWDIVAAQEDLHHMMPSSKLSWDREEQKRERRRHRNRKTLERRGIRLREDYEQARMLVDITQDLHPGEHRRLVERYNRKLEEEQRMAKAHRNRDEDMAYWGRFLQDDVSLPTQAPVTTATPTTQLPLPDEPTAAPIAVTSVPTVSPTGSPVATSAPTLAPVGTPVTTSTPTQAPVGTPVTTSSPTQAPVGTPVTTSSPTLAPVGTPVTTTAPTQAPVETPVTTSAPTLTPTLAPVGTPVVTDSPTTAPVAATLSPTISPVEVPDPTPPPTTSPTQAPTSPPTQAPVANTASPTRSPTLSPVATPTSTPTINRARQVILPVALFGGTEFDDPETYQSKSLSWLENSNLDPYNDDKLIQRYALGCIYYATNNVSTAFTDAVLAPGVIFPWNNERDWLSDLDECTWSNVLCDDSCAAGFICRMDFFGNFLTGEFPAEITYLKGSLNNLDLSDNPTFTRGETFNSWLGTLTNLERLRYEDTNFINSNGIPTEIGNLKNLGFYECSNIRYVGTISGLAFPADMTQLSYIEMEFNTFNSPIPTEIGLLPNLQFFYSRDSSITGNLEFMRNMNSIVECWTDRNQGMTGNLPDFFGDLTTLGSLSVTRSGWSGPLPTQLGLLVDSMRQMYFYNNQFTGQVPSEWSQLTNLEDLELQNNLLTGQIPQSVCFLKFTRGLNLEADCDICNPINCCSACVP